MKNKKGFTIVELLAVIVVLGLLITMVMPNIMDLFDEKKQVLYENTIEEIERITGMYLTENPDLYLEIESNGYTNVQLQTLCSAKLINCPLNDPRDNTEIKGYVKVSYENNKYIYLFVRT